MKHYWNNLNVREQWMLGFGIIFVFFFLLYLLVLAPLSHAVQDKSQQFRDKQATLIWMQQAHQQYKRVIAPKVLSRSKLLTVLAAQLKSTPFHHVPYQLQQTGSGDIQLSFDHVPYNAFVTWLWSVNKHYAFTIKQLNVERTTTAGVVKMMVVIAV